MLIYMLPIFLGNTYLHVVRLLGNTFSVLHIDRIGNAFSVLHIDKIGNVLFFIMFRQRLFTCLSF